MTAYFCFKIKLISFTSGIVPRISIFGVLNKTEMEQIQYKNPVKKWESYSKGEVSTNSLSFNPTAV